MQRLFTRTPPGPEGSNGSDEIRVPWVAWPLFLPARPAKAQKGRMPSRRGQKKTRGRKGRNRKHCKNGAARLPAAKDAGIFRPRREIAPAAGTIFAAAKENGKAAGSAGRTNRPGISKKFFSSANLHLGFQNCPGMQLCGAFARFPPPHKLEEQFRPAQETPTRPIILAGKRTLKTPQNADSAMGRARPHCGGNFPREGLRERLFHNGTPPRECPPSGCPGVAADAKGPQGKPRLIDAGFRLFEGGLKRPGVGPVRLRAELYDDARLDGL